MNYPEFKKTSIIPETPPTIATTGTAPTVATDNSGDCFEKEKREAKEWELWRDFLYEVGCNRRFLDGAVWEDTEWEKLMDILKKDFTIARKV